MLDLCRDVSGEVGLLSVHVRRGRLNVGTFSARSGVCRDVFGEVVLVSRLVRQGWINVGTCSAIST